jgi:signal peptidase I
MAFSFRRNAPAADSSDGDKARNDVGLVRFLLSLALIAWIVRSFFLATFYIPSSSMLPSLYIGDYLFVAKWPYGYSRYSFPFGFPKFDGRILGALPERGDVVVFRHPVEDADLIKRVIGLPGDTVEIRGGRLILNGRPVNLSNPRPHTIPITPNSPCNSVLDRAAGDAACDFFSYRETLPGGPGYTVLDQLGSPLDDFQPTTVPDGHLFVMGDNRDSSADSRIAAPLGGVGFLPVDNLIGRAMVTVWSTDGSASYWLPWTWFTALRGSRIGNGYSGDAE